MKKFKGWDWIELGDAWGFSHNLSDKTMAKRIRNRINESLFTNQEKEVAKDCRDFLKALIKWTGYDKPLWQGLLRIKNDETLLKFIDILLECMWT